MRIFCRAVLMAVILSVTQFVWTALPILEIKQVPGPGWSAGSPGAQQTPRQALACKVMAWLMVNRSTAWAMPGYNPQAMLGSNPAGINPYFVFSMNRLTGNEGGIMLQIPSNQLVPDVALPTSPGSYFVAKYDTLSLMGEITRYTVKAVGKNIQIEAVPLTPSHTARYGPWMDKLRWDFYDAGWSGDPSCQTAAAYTQYYPNYDGNHTYQATGEGKKQAIADGNPCLVPLAMSKWINQTTQTDDGLWHMSYEQFQGMLMFLGHEWQPSEILCAIGKAYPDQSVSTDGGWFTVKTTMHTWVDLKPDWWGAVPTVDGLGVQNSASQVLQGIIGMEGNKWQWVEANSNGNFDFTSTRLYDQTTSTSSWGSIFVVLISTIAFAIAAATGNYELLPDIISIDGATAGAVGAALGATGGLMTTQGQFSNNVGVSTFIPYSNGTKGTTPLNLSGIMGSAQAAMPGLWTNALAHNTTGAVGTMAAKVDLRKMMQCIGTKGTDCNTAVELVSMGDPRYAEIMDKAFFHAERPLMQDQIAAPYPNQEAPNPYSKVIPPPIPLGNTTATQTGTGGNPSDWHQ